MKRKNDMKTYVMKWTNIPWNKHILYEMNRYDVKWSNEKYDMNRRNIKWNKLYEMKTYEMNAYYMKWEHFIWSKTMWFQMNIWY